MPYTHETKLTVAHQTERDMLIRGFSYAEIAAATGGRHASIKERNRLVYGIDLRAAYEARVERDGIPNRYAGGDAFGFWFAGYFDGEGCLTVFDRTRGRYSERRVGVQIACRNDDVGVLDEIYSTLGIGVRWLSKANGTTSPACNWRVESVADLAEVMLPLFDHYPMRSKKRLEYAIWRRLVVNQYVNTLGGTATRVGASEEEHAAFQRARQEIRDIRHGTSPIAHLG